MQVVKFAINLHWSVDQHVCCIFHRSLLIIVTHRINAAAQQNVCWLHVNPAVVLEEGVDLYTGLGSLDYGRFFQDWSFHMPIALYVGIYCIVIC